MGRHPKHPLVVTDDQRSELQRLVRAHSTPQALAKRATMILYLDQGMNQRQTAEHIGCARSLVSHWRKRFIELGMYGLQDAPRSGRPRTISDERVAQVVEQTLETTPEGHTHWSQRLMAQHAGVSHDTVGRIWRAFGLKPHLKQSFRLSNDPEFIEKLHDVVGLYLSPPENALVLCVDEKPQIQAKQREVPIIPMQPCCAESHSSQYKRHGTTVLFAALEAASGKVMATCKRKRRSSEFVEFLEQVNQEAPADKELHLILDNLNTHKSPPVKRWLLEHPRVHLHFVPTYSSWLNLVESFFSQVQRRVLERGSFRSVAEVEQALMEYVEVTNQDPTPFKWTKSADLILKKIGRRCQRILQSCTS